MPTNGHRGWKALPRGSWGDGLRRAEMDGETALRIQRAREADYARLVLTGGEVRDLEAQPAACFAAMTADTVYVENVLASR